MSTSTLLVGLVCFCALSLAVPQVSFPINSQVPPVAQAAQPYDFQFAQNTFISTEGAALTYELGEAPAWLALDSSTRSLLGTPDPSSIGVVSFRIIASDGTGNASMPVTLAVTKGPSPQVAVNVSEVLSATGPLSDLQSLAVYPRAPFSITFPSDTFIGSSNITYYATSADRSPLPSWIRFNPVTLALSGVTPPPVPNPQVVAIRLIGSDTTGFASQSTLIKLIISDHQFAFTSIAQEVQARPSQNISISMSLLLDGSPSPEQAITSIQAVEADWLKIDRQSLTVTGQLPDHLQEQEIQIVASDIFNDNAYTYLRFAPSNQQTKPSALSSASAAARSASPSQNADTSSFSGSSAAPPRRSASRQDLIIVAIVLPIVALLVVFILCALCIRRRRRRREPQNYVEHFVDKTNKDRPKTQDHRLSLAVATTSPLASPEQRIWESQEQVVTMAGLGLTIPRPPPRRSGTKVDPLRSNAVSHTPKRPSRRLSKQSPRTIHQDSHWALPDARRGRASWAPVVHGARVHDQALFAKCIHCHSDELKCLNCGRRQIKSALDRVSVQRGSQVEGNCQPSLTKVVDQSSIYNVTSTESEQEQERREAEEHIMQPWEKKFAAYAKARRQSGRTGERFSNRGSASSSSNVRRWRSKHSLRGPEFSSMIRSLSDTSMPIPEESLERESRHVPGPSDDSEQSWVTEGASNENNTLNSVLGPHTRLHGSVDRVLGESDESQPEHAFGLRLIRDELTPDDEEPAAPGASEDAVIDGGPVLI
ncbi:MAG: hypothetical protein Q9159_007178 [Coniocarpon cinnabarinum]